MEGRAQWDMHTADRTRRVPKPRPRTPRMLSVPRRRYRIVIVRFMFTTHQRERDKVTPRAARSEPRTRSHYIRNVSSMYMFHSETVEI